MKHLKTGLIGALVLTTAATSILAWRQYQELVTLRAATLGSAASMSRIRELERLNQQLRGERVAADSRPSPETDDTPPNAPRNRNGPPRDGRGPDAAMRERMDSPQMQALRAIQQKAQLDQRYAGLFRTLNLPADKLEQLKGLLVERQATAMDVFAAARDQDLDLRSNPDQLRQLTASAQAGVDQSIKSLLGDSAYAEYQTYEQTGAQRNTVSQLERRLSYTDTPLTAEQSSQLVQILASTAPASTTGAPTETPFMGGRGGPEGRGGDGPTAAITDAAVSQASTVLSSTQVTALQQLQQQQQTQRQLQQSLNETSRTTVRSPGSGG